MTVLGALLFGLASTPPAAASDVDLFEPAASLASGEGTLQGESPVPGQEGFSGGVLAGFAQDPVVRRFDDDSIAPAVTALAPLHLQGSWTIEGTGRIDALLPVYAWVDAPLTGYRGAALGDARLQGSFPLWSSAEEAAHFALVPRVGLPTGATDALVSRGFSGTLLASVGGRVEDVSWVANTGFALSANQPLEGDDQGLGSTYELLGGSWYHVTEALRIGAEIDFDVGLAGGDGGTDDTGSAHLFAQNVLPSGVGLTVGAGTGLVSGLGTPQYRVFSALTYGAVQRDQDKDGIVDNEDACPTEAEDFDGWEDLDGCPELDNDGDGIFDTPDQCPDVAEDFDGWEDMDGCPEADNDHDGVVDTVDACPDEPGPAATEGCPDRDSDGVVDNEDDCPDTFGLAELRGCPDRDEDLVPDFRDKCPDDPKPPGEDPATSDGCPKAVYVTAGEIKITERVEFETGKHKLSVVSFPILDEVARVLIDNPRVEKIEVQGHTDNVGSSSYNLRLSDDRAAAVVAYLVSREVQSERITGKGYGEGEPLFTNRTPKGREGNRRVQFKILSQKAAVAPPPAPLPPSSPVSAPVPTKPQPAAAPAPTPHGPPGELSVKIGGGNWATIYIDGQKLTKAAPFSGIKLDPGPHELQAENHGKDIDYTTTIEVVSGEAVQVVVPTAGEDEPSDNPWGELQNLDDEDDGPWGEIDPPAPEATPAPEPAPEPQPEKKGRKSKKR